MILSFFPPEKHSEQSVGSLTSILQDFMFASYLTIRLTAFIELREWTAASSPAPGGAGTTRLETLLGLMESRSELRVCFQRGVREILLETRSVELFAEAGLHPVSRLERLRLIRHIVTSFLWSPRRFLLPSAKMWNQELIEDSTNLEDSEPH